MEQGPKVTGTTVAELAGIIKKSTEPQVVEFTRGHDEEVKVLLAPQGVEVKSMKPFLDEYLTAPERRKGTAKVAELASFIEHVNRFKDADSVIFADPLTTAPSLTAVLDYHRAGHDGHPRFGQHRTVYNFPVSDEWTAWTKKNATQMTQADFAAFLEDRITDVTLIEVEDLGEGVKDFARKLGVDFAPPQKLIELSRGLSVNVGAAVRNAQNLQSGEAAVSFVTEHKDTDGKPLRVPGAFLIAVPVFRSGVPYVIAARLRYRLSGPSITWFYELHRTDLIFKDAFEEACKTAREKTSLPLLVGAPEA